MRPGKKWTPYRLTVTREFTSGHLAGIKMEEDKVCDFPTKKMAEDCVDSINRQWKSGRLDYRFTTYRIEQVRS